MRKFPEKFLTIILTFVTYGPTNMSKNDIQGIYKLCLPTKKT